MGFFESRADDSLPLPAYYVTESVEGPYSDTEVFWPRPVPPPALDGAVGLQLKERSEFVLIEAAVEAEWEPREIAGTSRRFDDFLSRVHCAPSFSPLRGQSVGGSEGR